MGQQLSAVSRNDYEEMKALFDGLSDDAEKFYHNGNKSAGARLRKGYLQISKKCKIGRENVQVIKSQNPPKPYKDPENFL
jgi:hypothetical protein